MLSLPSTSNLLHDHAIELYLSLLGVPQSLTGPTPHKSTGMQITCPPSFQRYVDNRGLFVVNNVASVVEAGERLAESALNTISNAIDEVVVVVSKTIVEIDLAITNVASNVKQTVTSKLKSVKRGFRFDTLAAIVDNTVRITKRWKLNQISKKKHKGSIIYLATR